MSMPTVRDVHVDAALSQVSIAYMNQQYIGEQIFPSLPVQKKSDFYWIFPKSAWQRNDVAVRAPGARAARADYSVTTASYVALTYALAHAVPDEVRVNADSALNYNSALVQ